MASQLDMSLDDIIAKKKQANKPARKSVVVKKARQNVKIKRPSRIMGKRISKNLDLDGAFLRKAGPALGTTLTNGAGRKKKAAAGANRASIFSRLGGKAALGGRGGGRGNQGSAGTKVEVTNLNYDIMSEDIQELFGTIGTLRSAEVTYDLSGRSEGEAVVIFAKRSDAIEAVKKFNNRTLDGTAMEVKLAGPVSGGAGGNWAGRGRGRGAGRGANVRQGLFGTALGGAANVSSGRGGRGRGRGGARGRGRGNRGGGRAAANRNNVKAGIFGTALGVTGGRAAANRNNNVKAGIFGTALGVTGGQRGRGRRGRGRGRGNRQTAASMMELDDVHFSVTLGGANLTSGQSRRSVISGASLNSALPSGRRKPLYLS